MVKYSHLKHTNSVSKVLSMNTVHLCNQELAKAPGVIHLFTYTVLSQHNFVFNAVKTYKLKQCEIPS